MVVSGLIYHYIGTRGKEQPQNRTMTGYFSNICPGLFSIKLEDVAFCRLHPPFDFVQFLTCVLQLFSLLYFLSIGFYTHFVIFFFHPVHFLNYSHPADNCDKHRYYRNQNDTSCAMGIIARCTQDQDGFFVNYLYIYIYIYFITITAKKRNAKKLSVFFPKSTKQQFPCHNLIGFCLRKKYLSECFYYV